jgi:diguanylate cyclase
MGAPETRRPRSGPLDVPARLRRILIVDDEIDNLELLKVALAHKGFLLVTAAGGVEALAAVARELPDLILLDGMMPGMTGFEVASKLKGDLATQNIPIIIVTAMDYPTARKLARSAGAEDVISKPMALADLRARVRNLLRPIAVREPA